MIHLTSGGKYRGKIVKETPREVTIQTAGGEIVVPRNTIETIDTASAATSQAISTIRRSSTRPCSPRIPKR